MRGWRRWCAWAASTGGLGIPQEEIPAFRPTATQLGMFLQAESRRGPTVAPARLSALSWLQAELGICFPVESPCVKDFTHPTGAHHQPNPPRALSPEEFWNMVALAQGVESSKAHLVHLVLLVALCCIRSKHFARSSFHQKARTFIFTQALFFFV